MNEPDHVKVYILVGKEPIAIADAMEWGRWFENADRHIACTILGDVTVSTIFLGLDHNWWGGPPLLFETMVFGGMLQGEQDRYSTWAQAEAGHAAMVERVERSRSWWRKWLGL